MTGCNTVKKQNAQQLFEANALRAMESYCSFALNACLSGLFRNIVKRKVAQER
jgi:hypothetical protein